MATRAKAGQTATAPKPGERVKVTAAKGRPMLTWVGKRPLTEVTAFPAQHIETFDPAGELQRPRQSDVWTDWPAAYPQGGLLFHGDNKEVLAYLLANGFRGKVDLIYIDPPFDSGADYVRRVSLRGAKGTAKLDGEGYTLGEQLQYTDIWANDNYLQFMYERLLLLRELLSRDGVLVLHCDWRKSHHLRMLAEEIMGSESFRNEVYWYYYNKMHDERKEILPRATDTLLIYGNGEQSTFNRVAVPRERAVRQLKRVKVAGVLVNLRDESGQLVYQERETKTLDNVWPIPLIPPADVTQKTDYPTQKPIALLELVVLAYSEPNALVLDAFIGSGTTAQAAQELGRRWIGCDINKGAIQTTSKRLQGIIEEQVSEAARGDQSELVSEDGQEERPEPTQLSFTVWRVNDYDLQIQHNEAVNLACEHIGVQRTRTDSYFDGTLGKSLVKVIPFDHPLSPVDLEDLKKELESRPEEDRTVVIVCLGIELAARAWIENWNRLRRGKNAVNKIEVIELRSDPKYGKFLAHKPAAAKVEVHRRDGRIEVRIEDFISPTIIERLQQQTGIVKPQIDDWRAMVDSVMIDPAYDGDVFNVRMSDTPEKKTDLVSGRYEFPASDEPTTVAVKIIDMLGEEVLHSATV